VGRTYRNRRLAWFQSPGRAISDFADNPSANCLAAYMSMHITTSASGAYLENVWLWTADHDLDSASSTQISVYTGRGLLIELSGGTCWL
jgi:glucan 1,3-beta-glucosidase